MCSGTSMLYLFNGNETQSIRVEQPCTLRIEYHIVAKNRKLHLGVEDPAVNSYGKGNHRLL